MLTLKLTTIGNSVGVVLAKEALDKLHLEKGDKMYPQPSGYRRQQTHSLYCNGAVPALNGQALIADDPSYIVSILKLADGSLIETELAD